MPSSSLVVELRRVADGPWWILALLIAGVLSGVSLVIGVISGGAFPIAVPLHRIVVTDRVTWQVLLEFDAPVLEGRRVLDVMRTQAARLDREDLLRRWSTEDARRQELLAAEIGTT